MENSLFSLMLLVFLMIATSTAAQEPGKTVEYKYLGIRFVVPDGWTGQETQAGYLVGSHTEPGFALLSTHQYETLDQIRNQAKQGLYDQNGTMLTLSGDLEEIGKHALGGEFQGTLEGQPVKAFIIGLINPHGNGVTVLTAASTQLFSAVHKDLAVRLALSLQFYKAETPPVVEEWKQALQNAKLTYMESYNSGGGGVDIGGTIYSSGGGYSAREEIHLCEQGYFKYNSSSQMSVDHGAFGSAHGGAQGNGIWEVVGNAQGGATLKLNFHNGETYEYTLEYQDNKTLLNGRRYYRTYASSGADYAPDCFR